MDNNNNSSKYTLRLARGFEDLPNEIMDMITPLLTIDNLAVCVRLNKALYERLIDRIWYSIDLHHVMYYRFKAIYDPKEKDHNIPVSLQRNIHRIRILEVSFRDSLDYFYQPVNQRQEQAEQRLKDLNLKELHVEYRRHRSEEAEPESPVDMRSILQLLDRSKQLVRLSVHLAPFQTRENQERLLAALPQSLESLYLSDISYSSASLATPVNTHVLDDNKEKQSNKSRVTEVRALPNLKKLSLTIPNPNYRVVTPLLDRCPNLEELDLDHQSGKTSKKHDRRLCRVIYRGGGTNGWKTIGVKSSDGEAIGALCVSAILEHSSTLENLRISKCRAFNSPAIQTLLSSAPKLKRFDNIPSIMYEGDDPRRYMLKFWDIIRGEDWVCLELETFKCLIGQVPRMDLVREYHIEHGTIDEFDLDKFEEMRLYQRKVMAQLGRLTKLRVLSLGMNNARLQYYQDTSSAPSSEVGDHDDLGVTEPAVINGVLEEEEVIATEGQQENTGEGGGREEGRAVQDPETAHENNGNERNKEEDEEEEQEDLGSLEYAIQSLSMNLKDGLDELKSLSRLTRVAIWGMRVNQGAEETEWKIQHWPKLRDHGVQDRFWTERDHWVHLPFQCFQQLINRSMPSTTIESVLEIWPIRDSITASFTFRDFCMCVLVSKEWNRILTPSVWKVVESVKVINLDILLRYSPLIQELTIDWHDLSPLYRQHQEGIVTAPQKGLNNNLPDQHRPEQSINNHNTSHDSETALTPKLDKWIMTFPNLRVLKWWPRRHPVCTIPTAHEQALALFEFLECHPTIENLWIEMLKLDQDETFEQLCLVIESHPTLRRISFTSKWIHTSQRAQRFIWACRRLQSNRLEDGVGGRPGYINSRHGENAGAAAVRLCTRSDADTRLPIDAEEPNWDPIIMDDKFKGSGPSTTTITTTMTTTMTKIRSLNLVFEIPRKFWIYFPVFKMCPWLERLEIVSGNLEYMIPAMRECLHESCPNLTSLKITNVEDERTHLNWALALLCPSIGCNSAKGIRSLGERGAMATFRPRTDFVHETTHAAEQRLIYGFTTIFPTIAMAGTVGTGTAATNSSPDTATDKDAHLLSQWTRIPPLHADDCTGFRLKSFSIFEHLAHSKLDLPNGPCPWDLLVGHHGSTLEHLDLTAITMPLARLGALVSQIPNLSILKVRALWTRQSSDEMGASVAVIYKNQQKFLSRDRPGQEENDDESNKKEAKSAKEIYEKSICEDSTIYAEVGYMMGLKSWACACRSLKTLELRVQIEQPPHESSVKIDKARWMTERTVREYLVEEISQLDQLETLSFRTNARWAPMLTLPTSAISSSGGTKSISLSSWSSSTSSTSLYQTSSTKAVAEKAIAEEDENRWRKQGGPRNGGYLDRFMNLRWLQDLTWLQNIDVNLTVGDSEWILEHWPKLYRFYGRNNLAAEEARDGALLLRKRKPGLRVFYF
ncbi:hypothetical protein BGZ83_008347 [Gryganskiella cystojenkinii]|nr:hypothetical protein BGZ83_008347 [Gryganskiella cystojenkinii]